MKRAFLVRPLLWGCGGCAGIFILGAVAFRYERGAAASVPVAICATLGLDFLFTEPRFNLRVASPQDVFSLASFAGISLVVSHLSNRIRNNAARLQGTEQEQRALYEISRSALLIDWNNSGAEQFCILI